MSDIRKQIIRLSHAKPELGSHLLPLLREAGEKTAHGPVAINRPDVMLFMIDAENNNSKFYEMSVVPAGQETPAKKDKVWTGRGWVLQRRWGRLTDKGGVTGRVDSMNDYFHDDTQANRMMGQLKGEKTGKGYKDVSRTQEYPIGLGAAGFGWGGQAACAYIPELGQLHEEVESSLKNVARLQTYVNAIARQDSSMGRKLNTMLEPLIGQMRAVDQYLEMQLSECRR